MTAKKRRCWLHRWTPIEHSAWVGGIVYPAFRRTCRRCGATKIERVGP